MLELPFHRELRDAKCVLLAGAGGGFDVFCGLTGTPCTPQAALLSVDQQ